MRLERKINNYAHTSLQNCHNNLKLGHQKLDPELELENIQKNLAKSKTPSPKSKDKKSTKKASMESLIDTFGNPPAPPEELDDHISTGTLAYQQKFLQAI